MKKWIMLWVVLSLVLTVQFSGFISNSGIVLGAGNSYDKGICYDSSYRALLVRQLQDAQHDLAVAEEDFNWAVQHHVGVLMAQQRVLQAQRHVRDCQQRLDDYDRRNLN